MIRRPAALWAAVLLVGVSATSGGTSSVSGASSRESVPLLSWPRSFTLERDLPAVVRARIVREQQKVLKVARGAANEPAARAGGCVPSDFPGSLGPPAPEVSPRVLGHQVEVVITFGRWPRSLVCRPWLLRVIVRSKDGRLNLDSRFWAHARRGRAVVDLPLFGRPPYRLDVTAESLFGRRRPTVELPLRCPGTGDVVRGCLAGATGLAIPRPVLPIRGLTRASLEASLDYLLTAQRRPPILHAAPSASQCPSLRMCEVEYVDRAFPDSPFQVRYGIAGQQISGCWTGRHQGILGQRPYEDAGGVPCPSPPAPPGFAERTSQGTLSRPRLPLASLAGRARPFTPCALSHKE